MSQQTVVLSDAWIDFVAGWCSGAVSVVALQPLDTVLTRWQGMTMPSSPPLSSHGAALHAATSKTTTASAASSISSTAASSGNSSSSSSSSSSRASNLPSPSNHSRSFTSRRISSISSSGSSSGWTSSFHVARTFTQEAGVHSLWRGCAPMMGAVPVQNALLMGGYGIGQQWVDRDHPDRIAAVFVGGTLGGVLQSFLMSPVEWIKIKAQMHNTTPGRPPPTVRALTRQLSTHLSTGLGATLLRDSIPHGVWFATYEMSKQHFHRYREQQLHIAAHRSDYDGMNSSDSYYDYNDWLWVLSSSSAMPPLLAGAVAATTAWLVGYPADLIKTRVQAGITASAAASAVTAAANTPAPHPAGVVSVAQEIIRAHGWRGLYRGLGLKLTRAIPASMIGFTTYESVKSALIRQVD